jgi:hypothetical protein
MPVWLSILISIAVKLGMPWLLKLFPWLPASIAVEIQSLIGSLTKAKRAHRLHQKDKIRSAKVRVHRSLIFAGQKCT